MLSMASCLHFCCQAKLVLAWSWWRRCHSSCASYFHTRSRQTEEAQPVASQRPSRRLKPAEVRARSRLIPLIEYGAAGSYIIICPQEGVLPLQPDSPEWFEWLASLSSFRFVGQQGRFTAYHERGHQDPTRSWRAYRSLHNRLYKHSLGVTELLSIKRLEQVAALLQSELATAS